MGPLGIDDGAQAGQKTSLLVTPEKEATLELKTGARVVVPAGSVEKPVELGLERPSDKEAVELTQTLKSDEKIGSAPYIVTPHGSEFKEEVEVTLPLSAESDKSKVTVAYLEDEKDTEWKYLTSPSFVGNYATFTVSHFSVLILVERARPSGSQTPTDEGRDAGRAASEDMDAGKTVRDAGSIQTMPDASPPDECVPAKTCAEAVLRPSAGECGDVSDGCGGTLYCRNTCAAGEYCDEPNRDCKPSACGTSCDALEPWAGYCDYDGLGAYCFPGDPAYRCDEETAECVQDGLCMQCRGKCISDSEGCDPDEVRLIGSAGGSIESEFSGKVTVPANAVAKETEFRIVLNPTFGDAGGFAPSLPSPYSDYGVHCFGPYYDTFQAAVTVDLTFSYNPPVKPSSVAIFKLADQSATEWTQVSGVTISPPAAAGEGYKATLQTNVLGCYALGVSFDL